MTPPGLDLLTAAGDGKCAVLDVVGYGASGGDKGIAADIDGRHKIDVAADKAVVANRRFVFAPAVVIDDDMTLEDYAASYMKACPSNEVACFFDCTNVLNQYKTWNKALPEVQPFYGTRTAFV